MYYGRLKSADNSITHTGDNLTGEGDGDDEVIKINLPLVSPQVDSLWPCITIYSGGMQFDDVSGAYCRIMHGTTKKEFCRFNLSLNLDNISNGCIVANINRCGDGWTLKARGYYTKNTKTAQQVEPIIKELLANDFSNIKILRPGEFDNHPKAMRLR